MSRNGTDFGIRVSGTGDAWFTAPVEMPVGLYFPATAPGTPTPTWAIRRSSRPSGLGAFAMAAAPAVVGFVGAGPASGAAVFTRSMGEITVGQQSGMDDPALDGAGVPTGIDIRLVVETGLAPHHQYRHRPPPSRAWARWAPACVEGADQMLRAGAGGVCREDGRSVTCHPQRGRAEASISTSIALMRIARAIAALPGVEEAGLMIGTPANKEILREAGVLGRRRRQARTRRPHHRAAGERARRGRGRDGRGAPPAGSAARRRLGRRRLAAAHAARGRAADARRQPGADLGARRFRRRRGAEGAAARPQRHDLLRQRAAARGGGAQARERAISSCFVMGPDCGTAIIAGVPLALRQRRAAAATSASSALPAPASRRCPA